MPSWAFRTPGGHAHSRILRAALVTAVVPTVAALLALWTFPGGCDLRGSPAVYRWTCLLPGLFVAMPAAVAVLLSIFTLLNRRLKRPLPDGWLAMVLAAGVLAQTILLGSWLIALDPAYRSLFLEEVLLIPQPFVAAATSAAAYWIALHWDAILGR